MNERKLTPEETEYLFRIIEQNGVKFYDVQMELVDHFATAIEKKWKNNSELTFNEAFRQEYKQLLEMDFERIQQEKENALQRKYRKMELRYISDFFGWPKIVATSLLTFLIYQVFFLFPNYLKFVAFAVAFDILLVLYFSYLTIVRSKNNKYLSGHRAEIQ